MALSISSKEDERGGLLIGEMYTPKRKKRHPKARNAPAESKIGVRVVAIPHERLGRSRR